MANLTYFKKFETKNDYDTYIGGDPVLPNVSIVAVEDVYYTDGEGPEPPHDYSKDYLTFNITSDGYVNWICMGEDSATIEYKKNDGEWTSLTSTAEGTKVNVVAGDVVQFRGDNDTYAALDEQGQLSNIYGAFGFSTCQFTVEGNIMSMINSTDYGNITTMTSDNNAVFAYLFAMCTGLTSAENLILPASTLAYGCYEYMFGGCTSLTIAPELPATTLASYCYFEMFGGCTSLTIAPELPATALASNCYYNMFSSCESLTTAPELPATTLADKCYTQMFFRCTGLTAASVLPAITLAEWCYHRMFEGCSSLTTVPALPATTLAEGCYDSMFRDCNSLNYIKCLATDISASMCTIDWVSRVAASGTFIKNPNMSSWTTGRDGIPEGWTVEDA